MFFLDIELLVEICYLFAFKHVNLLPSDFYFSSEKSSILIIFHLLKSYFSYPNALYSHPYLNQQKPLFFPIIAYTLSTTKLEIRAK
jgi:hypothetical protein